MILNETMQPRWLKLKQTSRYAAMNPKALIALAKEGRIVGFQYPDSGRSDWIFDRLSIDEYRESQAGALETEHKELDASQRAGICG